MIRRTFIAGVAALSVLARIGQPKKTEIQRLQSLIDAHRTNIPQGDIYCKETLRVEGSAVLFVDQLSPNKKKQYEKATLDERAAMIGLWSRQEIQKYMAKNPGDCFDNDRNWPEITEVVGDEIFIYVQFAYGAKNGLTSEQIEELQAVMDEAYGDPIPNNFQGRVPPSGKTLEQIEKDIDEYNSTGGFYALDTNSMSSLKKHVVQYGKGHKLHVERFIAAEMDDGYYFRSHDDCPTPKIEGLFDGRLKISFCHGADPTMGSSYPSTGYRRKDILAMRS